MSETMNGNKLASYLQSFMQRHLLMRGADVYVTVKDVQFRRSPLIQGGLEIPVNVTASMESSSKNIQAVERFKSLVELSYKEPVNGNFNDCTSEILKELGAEEIDYEDDEDIE